MLYHFKYLEISIDNLNISKDPDLDPASFKETAEEDLMKEHVALLSELKTIDEEDKEELISMLSDLKKADLYGFEAEGLLKHLLS